MKGDVFAVALLVGVVLPGLVGLGVSFALVGKGNRLFWIIPFLLLWYGTGLLVSWFMPLKISVTMFVAEWIKAIVVIAGAYAVRRARASGKRIDP